MDFQELIQRRNFMEACSMCLNLLFWHQYPFRIVSLIWIIGETYAEACCFTMTYIAHPRVPCMCIVPLIYLQLIRIIFFSVFIGLSGTVSMSSGFFIFNIIIILFNYLFKRTAKDAMFGVSNSECLTKLHGFSLNASSKIAT